MELPPHPMRLGDDAQAYYVGNRTSAQRPGQAAQAALDSLRSDPDAAALAVAAGEGDYSGDITSPRGDADGGHP